MAAILAILQKLKEQGWHLSEDGLKKISDDGILTDTRELVKRAIDFDLREISKGGGLAPDYAKLPKLDVPSCGIVLQVQSIRNVSAPKANEESKTAPRMLLVELTDGQTVCTALEFDPVPSLSVNTAPGTKVLLKNNIKLVQGMLMLNAQSLSVIGGNVALMYEKWDTQRTLNKYAKGIRPNTGPGGPPPWITFGQKSQQQQALSSNKAFKSLADKEKGESKENVEFTTMRTQAVAEAMKVKTKKVFGGGNRQLVDYNVKKIIEKGYTEDQAKFALKYARNNLEQAMGSLKRRDDKVVGSKGVESSGRREAGSYEGRRGSSAGGFKDDRRKGKQLDVTEGAKPSAKVSLFDFLENKIPKTSESIAAPAMAQQSHVSNAFNNNTRTSTNPFSKPISNLAYKKPEEPVFRNPYSKHHDDAPAYGSSNRNIHSKQQSPPAVSSQHHSSHQAVSNVSSSGSVPSSKNPFSLENRSKFENNISASFANRQKRDDELEPPPSRSNKNFSNKSSYPSTSNQRYQGGSSINAASDSKYSGRDRNFGDTRNAIDSRNNNQSNESRNQNEPRSYSKPSSNPIAQSSSTPYNASANYQQNATKFMKGGVLATEPKSASNRYHDDNKIDRRPPGKSHATQPPSSAASNINNLIKSTAGMKLSSQPQAATARPSSTGGVLSSTPFQTKPTTQTSNAFDKVFPQMPSGFEYNPYKIMGFQNKETNEFAMNVLKSQSFDNIPPAHMVSGQGQGARQDAYVPIPMAYAARPPPQQQQSQKQHFSNGGGVNFQPFTWPHSLHDICFAKYWEDGRYYNAEITGMSDKTCVVQFMEYGNFEEVLLSDCVPITEGNIQMVGQYNANLALQGPHYPHPPIQQQQPTQTLHHQQPQQHHHQQQLQNSNFHNQQQQRFRGERQMYVPPAQRSTK